ncbi:polyprenol phosphomannose-dependent alpha 1,6 mannosyltransferase MptB [Nocardioides sp. CN2-186]|uniref:polyprenol phosphomannose-dependent alpha 1,6 mannosyltransferase MptB n=1 Tax=Nocardioides tweenelious TaxID=3156607 RepID=UPI0032B5B76A
MITRGAVGSVLVLLGGLVTQVLPWSSPMADAPLLGTMRESTTGRMIGLVVVVAGLALLGSAWLQLLRATHPNTGLPTGQRLKTVHVAALSWSAPLLLAPPLFSRDGWSYAAQGALTHIGLSPYIWTPSIFDGQIREGVDPLWLNTLTPYGPLPLAWGSFVAGITDNPWLMVVGYRVLALVGLAILARAVPRLARATGQDVARASALVIACPLTIAQGVGGVHNDLIMAALMAAALAVALDHSWVLGAVLAGAAAAVKVPGGVVAIGVALVSLPLLAGLFPRLRRLTAVGAVAVAVLVGSGALIGVGTGWIHALGTPGIVRTPLSLTTQVGVLLGHVDGHALAIVRTLGLAVAAALVAWFALRGRTGDRASAVRTTANLATAVVLLGPAVHGWYLLWALPFLAACAWGPPIDALVRDAALLLGIIAPLDSSLRGAPTEIIVVAALVIATAIRLRLSHREPQAAPPQAGVPQRLSGSSLAP